MNNLDLKINARLIGIALFLFFLLDSIIKVNAQPCIKSGLYNNNRTDYEIIKPCDAKKITFTFSIFKVADAGDILTVYDGTDASGKPLHIGSGFTLGNAPTGPLIAYSGAMYFYFKTNGTGTDSGWAGCYTVERDSTKPIAKFEIPDTIYNSVKYTYKNTSQNVSGKTDYVWEIEPGYGEVGYSKDLNYTLNTNNKYDVTLTATTCVGWSKYKKSVVLITPDYKVALDFKAKNTQPIINKVDTLSAIHFSDFKRPNKADRFHWYFYPDSVTYLNGTSADSPTIQVKFNTKGKYKVTLEAWNTVSPIVSYNEVIKKDYITVKGPPSPKVYIDIIAKKLNLIVGDTDTLFAADSIAGKLYKANRFQWEFYPNTVTYLNGTSPDLKTIQVKFNEERKYTVHLKGWNSSDSALTFSDTIKTDFITVKKPIIPKAYFDFEAKNLTPKVGEIDTLFVIDSILGKKGKANHFQWQISPNRFTYVNGTNAQSKIIQVRFKFEGSYTVTLFGWDSADSVATFNDTIKTNYLKVKGTANYKVYLDFVAKIINPKVGDIDTIVAIDSISGKPFKANRFRWEFMPDNVSYVNGTAEDMQTIHVKFNDKGKYTISLYGWNSADSAATFNSIFKKDYISVEEPTNSTNDISLSSLFNIYPNPSTGIINFECDETINIQIYNSMGLLVKEINCTGIQTLDMSNQSSGFYTVKIKTNSKQIIQKVFIIEE